MSLDRFADAVRRVVRECLPEYRLHGFYPYRVARVPLTPSGEFSVPNGRLDLVAVDPSHGLPEQLVDCPVRSWGSIYTPTIGAVVLVGFEAGSARAPFVAFGTTADESGFRPAAIHHGATGTTYLGGTSALGATHKPVARQGDAVQVSVTLAGELVAPSGGGPVTGTISAIGTITSVASTKVQAAS